MVGGLPILSQPIASNNISAIREIGYWGSPVVRSFEITTDGNLGFAATTGGVFVYDLASNEVVNHVDLIIREDWRGGALSLSRDGRRFVVLTEVEAIVWDLNKGIIFKIPLNATDPRYLSPITEISPNGNLLAIRDCEIAFPQDEFCVPLNITIYDLTLGQKIQNQPKLGGWNILFRFSPDDSLFVVENGSLPKEASIWNTDDWSKLGDISLSQKQTIGGVSFDGKLLGLQDDEKVLIYQINPWKLIRQINASLPGVENKRSFLFSPSGETISVQEENKVSVWNITTGERLYFQPTPADYFSQCLLNDNDGLACFQIPDQVYQFMNSDKDQYANARLKNQDTTGALMILKSLFHKEDNGYIYDSYLACLIPINSTMTCQDYPDLTFLNQDGQLYSLRQTDEVEVYQVYLSKDGLDSSLGYFRSSDMRNIPYWISDDGRYLVIGKASWSVGGYNQRYVTEMWNIQTESLIKRWQGFVRHFASGPDGFTYAFALMKICGVRECGSSFIVYDALENKTLLDQADQKVGPMEFTKDGKLIYFFPENMGTAGSIIRLNILDPENQEKDQLEISFTVNDYNDLYDISISPDGNLLAIGLPNGAIRVFNLVNEIEVYTWLAHSGEINDLEFTSNGTILLSSSIIGPYQGDGYIKAWGLWP
jgi:WD40 repeat protein